MAIAYWKELQEEAKAAGDKYLFQISIDGKYLSDKNAAKFQKLFMGHGRTQVTGKVTLKEAQELWEWYLRLAKRARRGKRKGVSNG